MLFTGLGEEVNEVCDKPGAGERVRAAGDGGADELVVFLGGVLGGCLASSTPLLTSSSIVSIGELFSSRSTTPS